jgi:cyclopropane fatty-acyl-phospholipid synthase-like methyltransferase
VYGLDASTSMIAAFRAQFPAAQTECSMVEDSRFFDRTFDGVIAWGLIFLLAPDAQSLLIRKVSRALNSGGRFLFTATSGLSSAMCRVISSKSAMARGAKITLLPMR